MPKKKRRKKARSTKRAPHKAAHHKAHAKRSKGAKRTHQHPGHAKPEGPSFSLLRAIKRRRAAERGNPSETHGNMGKGHRARKPGTGHHLGKHSHHPLEPVVTEKSFENMLAFRRFQNHAR